MLLIEKIKSAIDRKNIFFQIKKKLYPYFKGLYLIFFPKSKKIRISVTKLKEIDKSDINLGERIFNFYKKIKADENTMSDVYKPSTLWKSHIENDFKYLIQSFKNNDLEQFLYFLQNFGNWENYLGIENQTLVKKYSKNLFLKKFLKDEIFYGQYKFWKFFNPTEDLKNVQFPRFGNQIGATIDNKFVVIGSFFNQIYASILSNILEKNKRNVILDVGGGYGKLGYYLINKAKNSTFIDIDIPENLILASYFLCKSFPEKKSFFYGEKNIDASNFSSYELIFLPPWEIENLPDGKIDLTVNKNSLGEMNPETAKNYIDHISRISKYFFSMNHETFRNEFNNGKKSLINSEYNNGEFQELIRYPDLSHLFYENNKLNLESDIFFYLYRKKN